MNLLLKQFPMFFFYNSYAPNSFDKNLRYKIILENIKYHYSEEKINEYLSYLLY